MESEVLKKAEEYITEYFDTTMPSEYVYHDLDHTINVVKSVLELIKAYTISDEKIENLQLAAWFHDTGYANGPKDHEELSCKIAIQWLKDYQFSEERLDCICALIRSTKLPQNPSDELEQIIGDADLAHLGQNTYWERCDLIRQEIALLTGKHMTEKEWIDFELHFLENHKYHTAIAKKEYDKKKTKNIRELLKQKIRLYPNVDLPNDAADIFDAKMKKFKNPTSENAAKILGQDSSDDILIKDVKLGRGVETMYHTTYRVHVNLSSIADNKANIMLSINAIIISITFANLIPKITAEPYLLLPATSLMLTCMIAIVFATLSTRPKITEGKFTRKDIEDKKSNLLFFGNFYNMELEDYEWGVEEMIKDEDFLYSSMTRDLYFLGKVLAKKYRYLSITYGVFMYGLIITIALFLGSFAYYQLSA